MSRKRPHVPLALGFDEAPYLGHFTARRRPPTKKLKQQHPPPVQDDNNNDVAAATAQPAASSSFQRSLQWPQHLSPTGPTAFQKLHKKKRPAYGKRHSNKSNNNNDPSAPGGEEPTTSRTPAGMELAIPVPLHEARDDGGADTKAVAALSLSSSSSKKDGGKLRRSSQERHNNRKDRHSGSGGRSGRSTGHQKAPPPPSRTGTPMPMAHNKNKKNGPRIKTTKSAMITTTGGRTASLAEVAAEAAEAATVVAAATGPQASIPPPPPKTPKDTLARDHRRRPSRSPHDEKLQHCADNTSTETIQRTAGQKRKSNDDEDEREERQQKRTADAEGEEGQDKSRSNKNNNHHRDATHDTTHRQTPVLRTEDPAAAAAAAAAAPSHRNDSSVESTGTPDDDDDDDDDNGSSAIVQFQVSKKAPIITIVETATSALPKSNYMNPENLPNVVVFMPALQEYETALGAWIAKWDTPKSNGKSICASNAPPRMILRHQSVISVGPLLVGRRNVVDDDIGDIATLRPKPIVGRASKALATTGVTGGVGEKARFLSVVGCRNGDKAAIDVLRHIQFAAAKCLGGGGGGGGAVANVQANGKCQKTPLSPALFQIAGQDGQMGRGVSFPAGEWGYHVLIGRENVRDGCVVAVDVVLEENSTVPSTDSLEDVLELEQQECTAVVAPEEAENNSIGMAVEIFLGKRTKQTDMVDGSLEKLGSRRGPEASIDSHNEPTTEQSIDEAVQSDETGIAGQDEQVALEQKSRVDIEQEMRHSNIEENKMVGKRDVGVDEFAKENTKAVSKDRKSSSGGQIEGVEESSSAIELDSEVLESKKKLAKMSTTAAEPGMPPTTHRDTALDRSFREFDDPSEASSDSSEDFSMGDVPSQNSQPNSTSANPHHSRKGAAGLGNSASMRDMETGTLPAKSQKKPKVQLSAAKAPVSAGRASATNIRARRSSLESQPKNAESKHELGRGRPSLENLRNSFTTLWEDDDSSSSSDVFASLLDDDESGEEKKKGHVAVVFPKKPVVVDASEESDSLSDDFAAVDDIEKKYSPVKVAKKKAIQVGNNRYCRTNHRIMPPRKTFRLAMDDDESWSRSGFTDVEDDDGDDDEGSTSSGPMKAGSGRNGSEAKGRSNCDEDDDAEDDEDMAFLPFDTDVSDPVGITAIQGFCQAPCRKPNKCCTRHWFRIFMVAFLLASGIVQVPRMSKGEFVSMMASFGTGTSGSRTSSGNGRQLLPLSQT